MLAYIRNSVCSQYAWQMVLVASHSVDADDSNALDGSTWAGSFSLRATFVLTSSSLSVSLSTQNGPLSPSQSPTLSSLHASWTEGRKAGSGLGEQQQTASSLVVAPSICAHLSVSTLEGVRLLGLKNARFIDFEPAKNDRKAGSWASWFGGLSFQASQPPATREPSTAPEGVPAANAGADVGQTSLSSSLPGSIESSRASSEQIEKRNGVGGASPTPSSEAMKRRMAGRWWFHEPTGSGRLVQEKADYAEVTTPLQRIAWDDVRAVTMLDRVSRTRLPSH